jgi:hypothetical protein
MHVFGKISRVHFNGLINYKDNNTWSDGSLVNYTVCLSFQFVTILFVIIIWLSCPNFEDRKRGVQVAPSATSDSRIIEKEEN